MRILSIIIFLSSLLIFFFVSIAKNSLIGGAANMMTADTKDFLDDWDEE